MVNVVIADDHAVLRQALAEMLNSRGDYTVSGQAKDGNELVELLKTCSPDIVIMDIAMPNLDGIGALEKLHGNGGKCPPVLMLSADHAEKTIRAALKAGAKGYVPKDAGVEELEFAIRSVIKGNTYLSPSVTETLLKNPEGSSNKLKVLTQRELEIMRLIVDGNPNRVIAKTLHISTRTVDTHRSNILKKLAVKTNAELVRLALQSGLIEL